MEPSRTQPATTSADQPSRVPAGAWREAIRPYAQSDRRRTFLDLATSVVPYLVLLVLTGFALERSLWLALALAPLTAGFLLRTFILFHDCTHGSLFASRRANRWVGTGLGLLVYLPFERWGHSHAVHHATAGDLERRGTGDLPTLTVAEYRARSRWGRLGYRAFRNPIVMFGLGPLLSFVVAPRVVTRDMRPRLRRSVIRTNVVLAVLVTAACVWLGPVQYLVIQWPAAWLAGAAGIFLFYVQHQFEDVVWERGEDWDFADAALHGSSFLRLPKVLQFFSGNIGYHHVHHLSARVPNYRLQAAHDEIALFRDVPVLGLREALRAPRLKLWDESSRRLVTFADARRAPSTTNAPAAALAPR